MTPPGHRTAVIDIGTNSTRLLVAELGGDSLREIERRNRVTRLGGGLDLSGRLSSEAVEAVCATISEYLALAQELGADPIRAIATSAVRDAENGAAFVAELRERFDLTAEVLDGEEEARLTYLGASAGREPNGPTLVIDVGGGSTEIVVGSGDQIAFRSSLQAGVVRHSERHLSSDPPTAVELEGLAADVRGLVATATADQRAAACSFGIAVAGTPTSLAAIDLGLETYDPERVHGHLLGLETIQRTLSRLASLPLSERREVVGLHPDRAPTIVAGIVVLIEVMRAFGLDRIEVSEHDLLYGAAIYN